MATYVVSKTDEDWEGEERFKTKVQATERFQQIAATGHFVRIVVWDRNQPTELDRANDSKG